MGRIGDALIILMYVALATTLVMHSGTSSVINSAGYALSSNIKVATGQ